MDAREIETYLMELGHELAQAGMQQHARMLLVGGAYMLTQVGSRPSTNDIDAVLVDVADRVAWPLARPFQAAVRTVASRHALPASWLNDVIGDALRSFGPLPQGTLWRTYGPLEIYVPNVEYMLALKILAGRPSDLADARDLCLQAGITTRAAARRIVDAHITDVQIKQLNDVDGTLAQLFPSP